MPFYQHYSFDLWLTLIKSNPHFKKERALFFHKHLNTKHKSIEEVEKTFRKVDLMSNATNEKTGQNISANELYLLVLYLINDNATIFETLDLAWLRQEMESLTFDYLPLIYDHNTKNTLDKIKQSPESSVSLLSNTGFIEGKTLRKVLNELQIADYFDFQLYSDEAGLSKPNPLFFELMIQTAAVEKNKIIHVGDNPKADIAGGLAVGINVLQINSNDCRILNLLD